MSDKFVMQVSSTWDGAIPSIALDYDVRTENISGNAAAYSETTPDVFMVWGKDTAIAYNIVSDVSYSVSWWEEISDVYGA